MNAGAGAGVFGAAGAWPWNAWLSALKIGAAGGLNPAAVIENGAKVGGAKEKLVAAVFAVGLRPAHLALAVLGGSATFAVLRN